MTKLFPRRFLFLLVAQLLLVVIYPLMTGAYLQKLMLSIMFGVVLLSTLWAVAEKRKTFLAMTALGVFSILEQIVAAVAESMAAQMAANLGHALFFLIATFLILGYVLNDEEVTGDKIAAALCVYFFLAMLWSVAYQVLDILQPGAFAVSEFLAESTEAEGFSVYLYFSLVTLTTLGYGDVSPVSALARSLATVQAVVGQIYLTVLVARLIGLHIAAGHTAVRAGKKCADAPATEE